MNANEFVSKKACRSLGLLNFWVADLQAGVGPFLGIFLLSCGWQSGWIGTIMTIGGVAGMVMTAPAGALIDATSRKRMVIVVSSIFTAVAAFLILFSQNFWIVSGSQVATAIAGSVLGPGITGITLGIVGQRGFNRQNGYNQACNHAGNVISAALSGYLGMRFGMHAIVVLSAVFAILAVVTILSIPADSIDNDEARGLSKNAAEHDEARGMSSVFKSKGLLVLAAALAAFHLGNGAMLPLYGIAAASKAEGNPMMFVAFTIIIAQVTMVVASIVAMRMSEKSGYWMVLLISFIALPLRGYIASRMISHTGLYPVQILDGIGAGLQSVAVPGLVAKILDGTGRVNVGQGAVMTVQNMGAALSPAIGGWIAQEFGFSYSFQILGCFALISIALWLTYAKSLRSAYDKSGDCLTA